MAKKIKRKKYSLKKKRAGVVGRVRFIKRSMRKPAEARKKRSQGGARTLKAVKTSRTKKTVKKIHIRRGGIKPEIGETVSPRKQRTKRVSYQVNTKFGFYNELRALVVKAVPKIFPEVEKGLKKVGKIKLAVMTGSFLSIDNAQVDMLIVGDGVDIKKLTNFIREIEADLGKEISYVILSLEEFSYRIEIMDRFLRDILEAPHYKIINKVKL